MRFPCIKCGFCCQLLNRIPSMKGFDNGNGICAYLQGNLCNIYAKRPVICNIEKMYNIYFKEIITEKDFVIQNINCCINIIKEVGDKKALEEMNDVKNQFLGVL